MDLTNTQLHFMIERDSTNTFKDARFWFALLFFGALLSFLTITYP